MTVTQACSRCRIIGCPGPQDCLIDCLTCDDSKTVWCPAGEDCRDGYIVDADGEATNKKCPACRGKGEIRCPAC